MRLGWRISCSDRCKLDCLAFWSQWGQQDRQCTYNVTLKSVREIIVAVKKHKYYIFLCVCESAHAPYCIDICGLSGFDIFSDIISQRVPFSERNYRTQNFRFDFSLQILPKTFLILRRSQRDIAISVKMPLCKIPIILVRFEWKANFLDRISQKSQISNLIKIRPVGAELFHANWQTDTDRYDTANSGFSQVSERT
jgi:hypothetical protein